MGSVFCSIMKIRRLLIGFIIKVNFFFMLCLFIIFKMEFIYKNVWLHLSGESNMCRGSTESFDINLLRTWFVYIESKISPKDADQPPFILAFAGR